MLQITKSGFNTWNPEMNFCKSPAVSWSCPETAIETVSLSDSSICFLNRTCLRFRIISVTSSTIPLIVENSCSTPSTRNDVIANPSREDNNTLLKAFPTVKPKPYSKGLNSNLPEKSVDSIIITLSGFWKFKIAILFSSF